MSKSQSSARGVLGSRIKTSLRRFGLRVLVIGVSGFLGKHLTDHLLHLGHEVEGWARTPILNSQVDFRSVDLLDPKTLPQQMQAPDAAVLLSGHSVPGMNWDPSMVQENSTMAANALTFLADMHPGLRVLFASSAHVYGPSEGPLREVAPLLPQNLYGLSKQLSEAWAVYFQSRLNIQIVRIFNQLGPGLPRGLVVTDLLERLSETEGPLAMKGSNTIRDFLDVRDGVRGLEALLKVETPSGSAWNLCSGKPVSIETLAQGLMARLGQKREIKFLGSEGNSVTGDPSKLRSATGWASIHDLDSSLDSLFSPT
jgi:nucleoside-diphosphate-sugar epimerase